jgi:hypothetical protein
VCRAAKSRQGDHFHAAIGLRAQLEGVAPTIPDWADDQHTLAGEKAEPWSRPFPQRGRDADPPPTADDPYENEAYRLWTIKQQGSLARLTKGTVFVHPLQFERCSSTFTMSFAFWQST